MKKYNDEDAVREVAQLLAGKTLWALDATDQAQMELVRVVGWGHTDTQALVIAERLGRPPGPCSFAQDVVYTADPSASSSQFGYGVLCFSGTPELAAAKAAGPAQPTADQYPHKCLRCGSPAYVGFARTDCSNKACR